VASTPGRWALSTYFMISTIFNLGRIRPSMGDFPGAREVQEKALCVRTRVLGGENPDAGDRLGARELPKRRWWACTVGRRGRSTLISSGP
jgi:hypothetical protein